MTACPDAAWQDTSELVTRSVDVCDSLNTLFIETTVECERQRTVYDSHRRPHTFCHSTHTHTHTHTRCLKLKCCSRNTAKRSRCKNILVFCHKRFRFLGAWLHDISVLSVTHTCAHNYISCLALYYLPVHCAHKNIIFYLE